MKAVVMIITNRAGEVLLLKRSPDSRKFPNEWCFPGGKVDWIDKKVQTIKKGEHIIGEMIIPVHEESDEAAAWRETFEETEIDVVVFEDTKVIMGDPDFTVKVFQSLLEFEAEDVTKEFPNREHADYGFFNPFNLPDSIGKRTKIILEHTIFKK